MGFSIAILSLSRFLTIVGGERKNRGVGGGGSVGRGLSWIDESVGM